MTKISKMFSWGGYENVNWNDLVIWPSLQIQFNVCTELQFYYYLQIPFQFFVQLWKQCFILNPYPTNVENRVSS